MRTEKYELWQDNDQWYFHFKAANGEIVHPSEGYKNFGDAVQSLDLIKAKAANAPIIILRKPPRKANGK